MTVTHALEGRHTRIRAHPVLKENEEVTGAEDIVRLALVPPTWSDMLADCDSPRVKNVSITIANTQAGAGCTLETSRMVNLGMRSLLEGSSDIARSKIDEEY